MILPTSTKSSTWRPRVASAGRADPQTRGHHRRPGIERDRVAVDGDADRVQAILGLPAVEL